jgi:hypothetical protein
MLTRRQLTQLLLATPFAARAATPNPPRLLTIDGVNVSTGGSLVIGSPPSSGTLPTATVGSVYSASISVSGGTPPYTVTKTADKTTCTWPVVSISGSTVSIGAGPVAVESQTITVQVQDSASNTVSGTFTIPTVSRTGYAPNLAVLPQYTAGTASVTAWTALNVRGMAANTAYTDPVSGVKVVKITSASAPVSGHGWCSQYSEMGLMISQAWGSSLNTYSICVEQLNSSSSSGTSVFYVGDYTLGSGQVVNWRQLPSGVVEGNQTFSRLPGEAHIKYYFTSSQLIRFDTTNGVMAAAPLGVYPISGLSLDPGGGWMQISRNGKWASMVGPTSASGTAINLRTGAVVGTQSPSGFNELHMGYNDIVQITTGGADVYWNLATNTTFNGSAPGGASSEFHAAQLPGCFAWINSNMSHPFDIVVAPETTGAGVFVAMQGPSPYWGYVHNSGHWTQSAAANNFWFVMSMWHQGNESADAPWMYWNNLFVDSQTGLNYTLCGHYSNAYVNNGTQSDGTNGYYSQPHTTISDDGLLALFGSNMQLSGRIDAFLVEVPKH